MQKYVALLRGINVGGNNKIPMVKLKEMFENLGFKNVHTYINSGNIIFETKIDDEREIITAIGNGIKKTFHLNIKTIIRTTENLNAINEQIPKEWLNNKEMKTDIMFLWEDYANKETLELLNPKPEIDEAFYFEKAIIWHISDRKNLAKSNLNKLVGSKAYKNMTIRNVNTLRKLNILVKK